MTAPSLTIEFESLDAWKAEATRLFGPDWMTWAFKCPQCGRVASSRDYRDAGAPTTAVGKECLGRYKIGGGLGGCDWAAYGLIDICKVHITVDGKRMPVFEFAVPGEKPARFLIEPPVVCGACGSLMETDEWWVMKKHDGGPLPVPHPNRAHSCGSCGYLWMPMSSSPGDLMVYREGVLVWVG